MCGAIEAATVHSWLAPSASESRVRPDDTVHRPGRAGFGPCCGNGDGRARCASIDRPPFIRTQLLRSTPVLLDVPAHHARHSAPTPATPDIQDMQMIPFGLQVVPVDILVPPLRLDSPSQNTLHSFTFNSIAHLQFCPFGSTHWQHLPASAHRRNAARRRQQSCSNNERHGCPDRRDGAHRRPPLG